ncbi:MAG: PmoA family protein [Planctomycetaceae bacterium]|nr:PmoA family protein [Planctomycetaceae bacterium]
MERRDFLKNSLLTAGILGLGNQVFHGQPTSMVLGDEPAPPPVKPIPTYGDARADYLTAYIYDSQKSAAWIRWKNATLTCYRAEALQKYPYFYPLNSLKSGLSLTSETGQPWPHHRSVFFGADKVNGRNFWQNNPDKDRIVSKKLELGVIAAKSAELLNECAWTPSGSDPILADKRRFLLTILNDETYTLDCYFELTALTEVTIKPSNHGLFGVRTTEDISVDGGGTLVNSEGQERQENTLGKPAKWIASYGKRYGRGDGLIEGLAILAPPFEREPFKQGLWFTRNYGNFSPMPLNFMKSDIVLPQGDVLKLAYRIVAFTGDLDKDFFNKQWDEFAAVSEGKRS